MIDDTGGSVERDDDGDNEEADSDDGDGLTPAETDGNDTASKLPCRCIERVRDPIGDEAQDAPFSIVSRNRIEIFVGPSGVAFCERGLRLLNFEVR